MHRDIDSFTLGKSRHIDFGYFVTLRVSFRFDGLAVVNVAQWAFYLLISALKQSNVAT
jgi:hypothetical protein